MISQECTTDDLLLERDLLNNLPRLTLPLSKVKLEVFHILKSRADEIFKEKTSAMLSLEAQKIYWNLYPNTKCIDNDRNIEKSFRQSESSQSGEGIFKMDSGTVSKEYERMIKHISREIDLKEGDKMCAIHIHPIMSSNNPNNKKAKDLFLSGYRRMQKTLVDMPEKERPQFIMCYSHLSSTFANIYPDIFSYFTLPVTIQKKTSPYRYIFGPKSPHTHKRVSELKKQRELLLQSHHNTAALQKLDDEIAKNEAYIKMRDRYSVDDIGFAVASVKDFLNYDFG